MNLRIGYVNVRGLSRTSWRACCTLLTTHFDYLFVAETWFVNDHLYSRDRRFIASTPPAAKNAKGRQHKGIYLLGSREARSKVEKVTVTNYSITFVREGQSFTGVYFPPAKTLLMHVLAALLSSVASSAVILGDINTHFKDPLHQAGEPGPPERVELFQGFLASTDHHHLKQSTPQTLLTTDHCFVRSQFYQSATLQLLNNSTLKMDTDHRYTLSLTLGTALQQNSHVEGGTIQRFRVGRLSQPEMKAKIISLIQQETNLFHETDDVEVMNTQLVQFCQRVQEQTVGKVRSRTLHQPQEPPNASPKSTLATSIRLYKQACTASKENDVVFPTAQAQAEGIDAMAENLAILRKRWSGQPFQIPAHDPSQQPIEAWTVEDVAAEIEQQESEKSCGADGIHIQFLKVVKETGVTTWLQQLYNQCLVQGKTPEDWNRSEIHLLSKDTSKPRDADNVRPISIICMFRKVFERLLLLRFHADPWAQFHPAQAGFRRSYSTYTNAAVLHSLLVSKARSAVVFLDFKSAFDVLDHQRLDAKLEARGCPAPLRSLIQRLMFVQQKSRILINGQVSEWFSRSCGALQGSPLSPWLFNLFIDDLLYKVNTGISGIPICLFYADDGALVTNSKIDLSQKLKTVEDWTLENMLLLNPKKCAVITTRIGLPLLSVYGQAISRVESYTYLGFPVRAGGINFPEHLEQRVQAAVNRARWLGVQSDSWGPAHRLRVYKQFLAPMFEYGAPLVWAWATENAQNRESFRHGCAGFRDLMAWISNTSDGRHLVTSNLCGLSSLDERFRRLGVAYQLIIEQMSSQNPLKQLLAQSHSQSALLSFLKSLGDNPGYAKFKRVTNFQPTLRLALSRFLRQELQESVQQESLSSHLTSLILMSSRKVPGLSLADISLAAPVPTQSLLLQYRRGVFMLNSSCACDPEIRFHRGHETCLALTKPFKLNREQRRQKLKMQAELSLSRTTFTDVDYLLNSGQLKEASCILTDIRRQLRSIYKENKLKEAQD